MTVRALILRAPGTNCDRETAFAFAQVGALADRLHVNRLLDQPALLDDFQVLCLPGGFCYGDDLGAGTILASRLRHHLNDALHAFHDSGKLILGICNGFQALIKTGLLPGNDGVGTVTLGWNDSAGFEDRWVHLQVEAGNCVFLQQIEGLYLPVAHAEGKFVCSGSDVFGRLEQNGRIVLRYAPGPEANVGGTREGSPAHATAPRVPYPANPNGSWGDTAGICDATGRILGLMPHPERHVRPCQHPSATRGNHTDAPNGLALFRNAVGYFE